MKDKKRILLVSSLILLPFTFGLFQLTTYLLGPKGGYIAGFLGYWAYCLITAWLVSGSDLGYFKAMWNAQRNHSYAAWVGLAAACLCLLPRIGFLTGDDFATGVNFRTCLYIAGILGLAAVVAQSGLGTRLGHALVALLPLDPAAPATSFAALAGLTSALTFLVTANGVPALYTPLADTLAQASGFPVLSVLMIQVIGYATPLLPYQASPIVVAMSMGKVSPRDGTRLCLAVAAVTILILLPLDYLWFGLVGALG